MALHKFVAFCPGCQKTLVSDTTRIRAEEAAQVHFLITDHRAIIGQYYEPRIFRGA